MTRMQFFGVRTTDSLAFRLFPQWTRVLGLEGVTLEGVDLPLGRDLTRHRTAVRTLKRSEEVQGALVTSHKLSVVRAAGDLIDAFTPQAAQSKEVSALYKRAGTLWGAACDPDNCGLAMVHFLGEDYWQRHVDAEILSLGGGGATVALLLHLLHDKLRQPRRITIADIRQDNLAHCRAVADAGPPGRMQVSYVLGDTLSGHDHLVASLPPHSLVINATGMGKDIEGSPVSNAVQFPECGAVWELNYRGERPFLQQALAQQPTRALKITDGWHYFLHGWSSVMCLVFDVPRTPAMFAAFCRASEKYRSR